MQTIFTSAQTATQAGPKNCCTGALVKVTQGQGEAVLAAVVDGAVPPGVVRIAAAHASTCGLAGLSGPVTVDRA